MNGNSALAIFIIIFTLLMLGVFKTILALTTVMNNIEKDKRDNRKKKIEQKK